jgi:uncharacterized membrane protein
VSKSRLEAFSDGVFAIIITIMVLELKLPEGVDLESLSHLWPKFLSYVLSFVFLGIYWNNHHHLLQAVQKVHGSVLWPNLHLLFWLSLIPFSTAWMGENHFATLPVALYGAILLLAGAAYYFLVLRLIKSQGENSALAKAIGSDLKGKTSLLLYAIGTPLSFVSIWAALTLYVSVAIIWLCPDQRIEKTLAEKK